jgi:hypothetical protein
VNCFDGFVQIKISINANKCFEVERHEVIIKKEKSRVENVRKICKFEVNKKNLVEIYENISQGLWRFL